MQFEARVGGYYLPLERLISCRKSVESFFEAAAETEKLFKCRVCPAKVGWTPRGAVTRNTAWTWTEGWSTTSGWDSSNTKSEETTESITLGVSASSEVSNPSGSASVSASLSVEVSASKTVGKSFTETLSHGEGKDWSMSHTISFGADGAAWQYWATVPDTCGADLKVELKEIALTRHSSDQPACLPGSCDTSGDRGYCCTCLDGGFLNSKSTTGCKEPKCPPQASVMFSPNGLYRSSATCAKWLVFGETCEVGCQQWGFPGTVMLRCSTGGDVELLSNKCMGAASVKGAQMIHSGSCDSELKRSSLVNDIDGCLSQCTGDCGYFAFSHLPPPGSLTNCALYSTANGCPECTSCNKACNTDAAEKCSTNANSGTIPCIELGDGHGSSIMWLEMEGAAKVLSYNPRDPLYECFRTTEGAGLVGTWECNVGTYWGKIFTITWDYADDWSQNRPDDFIRVCAPLPLSYSLHSWYNTYQMDPPEIAE